MSLLTRNGIEGGYSAHKKGGLWVIELELPTWVADDLMAETLSTGGAKITRDPKDRFEGDFSLVVVRQGLPLLED